MTTLHWTTPTLVAALGLVLGFYLIERRTFFRLLRAARQAHDAEIGALRAAHEQVVATYERLLTERQTAGERALHLALTGSAVSVPAVVEEREPDAHERLSRLVSEETIAAGIASLKEEYRKIGVAVSDDELRDEVTLLLASGTGNFDAMRATYTVSAAARE